jgi:hypothetical protein
MFFRHEINPYSVSDKVTFRNVDKTLTLTVRGDASSLVIGLKKANDKLSSLTDDTPEKERAEAARLFASTIFGQEQGDSLCRFYADQLAVINACGMYFKERLGKKITKAQKR